MLLKSISRKISTPLLLPAGLATRGIEPTQLSPCLYSEQCSPRKDPTGFDCCGGDALLGKERAFTGARLYLNYCSVTWEVCKSFLKLPGSSQSTT